MMNTTQHTNQSRRKYYADYRKANRDKINMWRSQYLQANRVKVRRWQAKYRKANRVKRLAFLNAYRARKRQATIGELTDIHKVYQRARELRQWFNVTVDHIVPLIKGGSHQASNLQIIYGFENSRKRESLEYKARVIFT